MSVFMKYAKLWEMLITLGKSGSENKSGGAQ
jgi:hypothetical protein